MISTLIGGKDKGCFWRKANFLVELVEAVEVVKLVKAAESVELAELENGKWRMENDLPVSSP